ncbi:hypothetical protein B0H14DRAFT_2607713 [Mycena olivaceomarginata]|nr:hypothetical protein B0H14DRAFT_2607713 [Mycena olivaceomarginata]
MVLRNLQATQLGGYSECAGGLLSQLETCWQWKLRRVQIKSRARCIGSWKVELYTRKKYGRRRMPATFDSMVVDGRRLSNDEIYGSGSRLVLGKAIISGTGSPSLVGLAIISGTEDHNNQCFHQRVMIPFKLRDAPSGTIVMFIDLITDFGQMEPEEPQNQLEYASPSNLVPAAEHEEPVNELEYAARYMNLELVFNGTIAPQVLIDGRFSFHETEQGVPALRFGVEFALRRVLTKQKFILIPNTSTRVLRECLG